MPITVFANPDGAARLHERTKSVVVLCGDTWELPVQLFEFERWLEKDGKELPTGSYIADIGFSPRLGACGGGGVLSVSAMQALALANIEVWFTEYLDQ